MRDALAVLFKARRLPAPVSESVRLKWFDFPTTLWLMTLPAACVAAGLRLWFLTGNALNKNKGKEKTSDWAPFACAVATS